MTGENMVGNTFSSLQGSGVDLSYLKLLMNKFLVALQIIG